MNFESALCKDLFTTAQAHSARVVVVDASLPVLYPPWCPMVPMRGVPRAKTQDWMSPICRAIESYAMRPSRRSVPCICMATATGGL